MLSTIRRVLVPSRWVCAVSRAALFRGSAGQHQWRSLSTSRTVPMATATSTADIVDLRSDTITRPSDALRAVMATAPVGDDVYGEDPTVAALESTLCAATGKEAAVFVPSGTMGNLIALAAHCDRGDEIILGHGQHIFKYEGGGASALLGVAYHTIPNLDDGTMRLDDIRAAARPDDQHYPRTSLVCLENTHNACGGRVLSSAYIDSVGTLAREELGVPCHIDGARIFNAAAAAGASVKTLVGGADTISICLSKGLGCPVGSVLVGPDEFIYKARRARKMVGGGMRQCGILAAAGLWSLENIAPRLHEDHANAKALATGISSADGISVDADTVETNIVYFNIDPEVISLEAFVAEMGGKHGIVLQGAYTASGDNTGSCRIVTHHHVTSAHVERVVDAVHTVMKAAHE